MWEEVDADIVQKVIREEKNEAYKKFWAMFILWVIICMFWIMGVMPHADTLSLTPRAIQISYMLLLMLLLSIVLVVQGEYHRRTQTMKDAKYMIKVPCKGRERMNMKGSGDLFAGHYVSFTKPGNRDSGWVQISADFYPKCAIGTEILVIAADQTDPSKMRAFDPADFDL